MENKSVTGSPCQVGATLARIDNNVKWIMKIGSALILLGGVLFTRDWMQADAIAKINTDVATIEERIDNHVKNGVKHEPARRGP